MNEMLNIVEVVMEGSSNLIGPAGFEILVVGVVVGARVVVFMCVVVVVIVVVLVVVVMIAAGVV